MSRGISAARVRSVLATVALVAAVGGFVVLAANPELISDLRTAPQDEPAAPATIEERGYAFREQQPATAPTRNQDGVYRSGAQADPVGYDPCQPVEIVVNPTGAPRGATRLFEQALATVRDATGLDLRVVGTTDEVPRPGRGFSVRGYGDGYDPVLVAWSDASEFETLRGPALGDTGSLSTGPQGTNLVLMSGMMVLDTGGLTTLLAEQNGRERVRAVMLHELGHLVGLADVDDPDQLMHHERTDRTGFGAGDLAGLRVLGDLPCGFSREAPPSGTR